MGAETPSAAHRYSSNSLAFELRKSRLDSGPGDEANSHEYEFAREALLDLRRSSKDFHAIS
jgi:hypothetical protein